MHHTTSNSFGFTYAPQGQMSGQTRPGAISESWGFDADGRRTSNALSTTTTGVFPDFGFAQLRNTTFSVDARGKVLTTSDPTSYADAQTNTYSGLGHALTSNTTQRGLTSSLQVVNMGSIEQYTVDATGNVLTGSGAISMQVNGTIAPGGSNWSYSRSYNSQGRMTAESSTGGSRAFEYDGAGNNDWQKLLGGGSTPSEHRALRYDGVGRLRRAELAWVAQTGLFPAAPFKEGTEDYYYDALGRRVLTATTSSCALGASEVQTSCLASAAVVRTIWHGDQELAEIRMPNNASYAENDIGPTSVAASTGFDQNPYYGRVVYAHGPTVDQPLSVTRFGYTDYDNNVAVAWPTFTVVPLANWRRQSFLTAFANGDVEKQFTPGGTTCATTGAPRCVIVPRPAQYSMWEQQRGYTPPAWHGSLIEDKRESLIGLTYRRNRYYDPSSGRFTQEDPIGLAGGLNLFGFADGDPVNLSDPSGLRVCFAGPNGKVREIVRETERATNTTIQLDENNCIDHEGTGAGSFRRKKGPAFADLQDRFGELVGGSRTVGIIDGPAPAGGGGQTDAVAYAFVTVDVNYFRSASRPYKINVAGNCAVPALLFGNAWSPAAVIAHELGHAYSRSQNHFLSSESMVFENWHHAANGEPLRCAY